MRKCVLVFTRPSKRKEVGDVVAYDKRGKIALFHERYELSKSLRPGLLVLCKVLSETERFYLLRPLEIISNGRIPERYGDVEVWGEKAHKALMRQKEKGSIQH